MSVTTHTNSTVISSLSQQVKQLLRMDIEAIDVKWEEITDDGMLPVIHGENWIKIF